MYHHPEHEGLTLSYWARPTVALVLDTYVIMLFHLNLAIGSVLVSNLPASNFSRAIQTVETDSGRGRGEIFRKQGHVHNRRWNFALVQNQPSARQQSMSSTPRVFGAPTSQQINCYHRRPFPPSSHPSNPRRCSTIQSRPCSLAHSGYPGRCPCARGRLRRFSLPPRDSSRRAPRRRSSNILFRR